MNFKCFYVVIIITLAIALRGNGQCNNVNLIKNPGLEEYSCCPYQNMMMSCADFWTQPLPSGGTSEYLNSCAIDSLSGSGDGYYYYLLHSFFGDGYAGICNYAYNPATIPPNQYREYFQGELSSSLIAGQCYYCEYWVKLFNYKNSIPFCGIDALGIYFSDTLPKKADTEEMAMFFPSQVNNQTGRIISDTLNWILISDTFIAKGGEQYFTVGTFKQENEINKFFYSNPHNSESYYFFDNFSLCPCSDTLPPSQPENSVFTPNVFSPNDDGSNDIFYVKGENIDQINMKVFNRWGNLVFETNNPAQGWDGRSHGKECAVGVYFYTATITFSNGASEQKMGNVTLVR